MSDKQIIKSILRKEKIRRLKQKENVIDGKPVSWKWNNIKIKVTKKPYKKKTKL